MGNIFGKIIFVIEGLVLDVRALASRLRARPLVERRAVFFTTFVIAATLTFSLWAQFVYRQFGIAFLQNNSLPPPSSSQNTASEEFGLRGPIQTLKENVSLLREEATGLISGLKQLGTSPGKEQEEQRITREIEPPLAKASSVSDQIIESSQEEERPPEKEETSLAPLPFLMPEKIAPEDLPLASVEEGVFPPKEEKKKSRIISILENNFAAMRQAFTDLYEYLLQ